MTILIAACLAFCLPFFPRQIGRSDFYEMAPDLGNTGVLKRFFFFKGEFCLKIHMIGCCKKTWVGDCIYKYAAIGWPLLMKKGEKMRTSVCSKF